MWSVNVTTTRKIPLIEQLDINNVTARSHFAHRETQQRIRLAQPEERMRFLAANRRKISVLAFSSDIMWAIALIS